MSTVTAPSPRPPAPTRGAEQHALASVRLSALGTDATLVVTRPLSLAAAHRLLVEELDAVDLACSRFRADAEIGMLELAAGAWVPVSDLLFEALAAAVSVAERTDGAVDPTVAGALRSLGYDRDFAAVAPEGADPGPPVGVPGWRALELDHGERRARLAPGVLLDLGASAKALAADRAATRIAALGTGVLVSLGGDIAVAGPAPADGWSIGVAAESATAPGRAELAVSLTSGGLTSSSTVSRRWRRGGRRLHHIVDPRTGDSAPDIWRLVTVVAGSCLDANAASTAAVVWGDDAPARLCAMGLPARLVHRDGTVVTTPGWPDPSESQRTVR